MDLGARFFFFFVVKVLAATAAAGKLAGHTGTTRCRGQKELGLDYMDVRQCRWAHAGWALHTLDRARTMNRATKMTIGRHVLSCKARMPCLQRRHCDTGCCTRLRSYLLGAGKVVMKGNPLRIGKWVLLQSTSSVQTQGQPRMQPLCNGVVLFSTRIWQTVVSCVRGTDSKHSDVSMPLTHAQMSLHRRIPRINTLPRPDTPHNWCRCISNSGPTHAAIVKHGRAPRPAAPDHGTSAHQPRSSASRGRCARSSHRQKT